MLPWWPERDPSVKTAQHALKKKQRDPTERREHMRKLRVASAQPSDSSARAGLVVSGHSAHRTRVPGTEGKMAAS